MYLPAGRLPLGPALAARARSDLRRLLFEQTLARAGGHCLIAGLTLQLLALLAQVGDAPSADRHPDELRDAVRRYAEELPGRFFEAAHLDQAAAELGMSRRRFTQLFREVTGSTWADLLAQLRIDYACQLLRATRRSVLSVAFECGYEDLSGFYRAFKRQTGLAPHAWRQWQAADSCPIGQNGLPDPPRQR